MTVIEEPDLEATLEQHLSSGEDEWDQSVLHISDLAVLLPVDDGGKCERELWMRLHGEAETEDPTPGRMLMWQMGLAAESVFEEAMTALPKGWALARTQHPVSLDYQGIDVTGTLDFELEHTDGRRIVVDTKTQRGRSMKYLDEPKPRHVLQVQGYLEARDAFHGKLFYMDQGGSNWVKEFDVPRNPERVHRALQYAGHIASLSTPPEGLMPEVSVRENKGPDTVYMGLPWQARYCNLEKCACSERLDWGKSKKVGTIRDGELELNEEVERHREYIEDQIPCG